MNNIDDSNNYNGDYYNINITRRMLANMDTATNDTSNNNKRYITECTL